MSSLPDLGPAVRTAADYLEIRRRVLRVPGVQAAVVIRGDVALNTAYGMADVESGSPLLPGHLFRIASHSKTFTATLTVQLVEAGRLRLDDAVGDHLDWVPAPLRQVTLRELLAHGAGVTRDGADADHWVLTRPFPDESRLRAALDEAAAVRPANERFKYSNIGFTLLGLVLEAVTGQPYAALVSERIAAPLGLRDTSADVVPSRLPDYATGYSSLSYDDARRPVDTVPTGVMAAATGVSSTALDTGRFFSAHAFGDERLLTDASKRRMQHREWEVAGTGGMHYGLGLDIQTVSDRTVVGHGGGFPGHITRTMLDPERAIAVSVFTNAIDGPANEMATGVMKLLLLAGDGDRAGEDRPELDRFTGAFADIWHRFDVVRFGGRLLGLQLNQPDPTNVAVELTPEDDATLRVTGGDTGFGAYGEPLRYSFTGDGSVARVRSANGITAEPLAAFAARLAAMSRVPAPD